VDQNQSSQEKASQAQPVEQTQAPKASPTDNQPKSSGKSNTGIIIAIVVMVLAILGVGGYFAFKYVASKFISQVSPSPTATATASTSGTTSVKAILEKLMYPGSGILNQQQEMVGVYVAELTLSSQDTIEKIQNYYLNLIEKEKWTVTRQGSDPDYDNYYVTFTDGVFTDELDITKYDLDSHTTIRHRLSGENLKSDGLYIPSATTTSTSSSSSAMESSGDYIISDSNTRLISKSELVNLTPWQLKVARNEIYARHGRPFVHEDMQCYFAKKSWYKSSDNFSESMLSSTENKNVATIQAYEKETDSPLASKDSGCDTNN
jgi:hypothetical protein